MEIRNEIVKELTEVVKLMVMTEGQLAEYLINRYQGNEDLQERFRNYDAARFDAFRRGMVEAKIFHVKTLLDSAQKYGIKI